uniref:Uncharacterized protein n=1 Tax=Psilotum nudum TaxID=3240 RepID=Q8W7U7_PSINU|nr:hypothetical protein PsnuCp152 [Psilotum nudum]NP_569704.1 hypothetical protein PsnuCp099 [Psilotum nudum]BAB84262.1 hypothetical protein [Psilotum nudum]BAB84293.1 hypothetical protein [Psilotum nudum]
MLPEILAVLYVRRKKLIKWRKLIKLSHTFVNSQIQLKKSCENSLVGFLIYPNMTENKERVLFREGIKRVRSSSSSFRIVPWSMMWKPDQILSHTYLFHSLPGGIGEMPRDRRIFNL